MRSIHLCPHFAHILRSDLHCSVDGTSHIIQIRIEQIRVHVQRHRSRLVPQHALQRLDIRSGMHIMAAGFAIAAGIAGFFAGWSGR